MSEVKASSVFMYQIEIGILYCVVEEKGKYVYNYTWSFLLYFFLQNTPHSQMNNKVSIGHFFKTC